MAVPPLIIGVVWSFRFLPMSYQRICLLMLKSLACRRHHLRMPHYRLRLTLTHGALP
jgi:hypothetical protein